MEHTLWRNENLESQIQVDRRNGGDLDTDNNLQREQRLEELYRTVAQRIKDAQPTEEELIAKATISQDLMQCNMDLPACASCGVPALPSDVAQHRRFNVVAELELLRRESLQSMSIEEKRIRSIFHIPDTN